MFMCIVSPSAPRSVNFTEVTSASAHLEWSSPQYTNGTITHYTIRCSQSGRNVWFNTSVTTNENVTSLQPFTHHTCCVSANNQAGEGNQSCVGARTQAGMRACIIMISEPISLPTAVQLLLQNLKVSLPFLLIATVLH